MPGLTLLNIDRETNSTIDPLKEIRGIIDEINDFISTVEPGVSKARLVPLKIKLRRLQDAVGQFGTAGEIPVTKKQSYIMELHPDLQLLANQLSRYGEEYSIQTQICMNFLLNHLCSTAASDPKSTVIGVSNVMAQVLSNEIITVRAPDFDLAPTNPKYFEEFSRIYNSMLTTAGLFSAPILGLPDIPISALGGWADQALEQFSIINQFVKEHYDPNVFYSIEKEQKATPFDTTTDIFSFYVYENEFLAALIGKADILSGLEFPSGFTQTDEPVRLQSTEEITVLLANSIKDNSNQILKHMEKIDDMFNTGIIDRNEKPEDHPHLMAYGVESRIWLNIAELGKYMIDLFKQSKNGDKSGMKVQLASTADSGFPPVDESNELNLQLHQTLKNLHELIFEMFPKAAKNTEVFIESSDFTKFRDYLKFIVHIIAAHDILIDTKYAWTPWLLNEMRPYLVGDASQFNPLGAMELGVLNIILGVMTDIEVLIEEGRSILQSVKDHLEFQVHHLLAIEILTKLSMIYKKEPQIIATNLINTIEEFIEEYNVNQESMLFQRANLYLAMLKMYKDQGEFLRKQNERFVAFDPFSWIKVPSNYSLDFPYMPLNTSIDNLNSN